MLRTILQILIRLGEGKPEMLHCSRKATGVAQTVAVLSLVALPQCALADSGSSSPSEVSDAANATITVTGHYRTGVASSDAASAGSVDGELLRAMPLLRPGEALETVPGLIVTQHSGDGKANQYFLRGYNLDHGTDFASSVDGVPVNMPTNAHGQGYSDLNFLIPELVERIDYRKGTYFAENGDFSAAGSADIRYRDRLEHGSAVLTAGSFGYQRALIADSFAFAHGQGPALLAAAELMRENGPWTTPENLRKTNLLLRLSNGDVKNGWSLEAIHYRAQWNSTDQIPLELIQSGALGRFDALDPTDGGTSGRDILSAEWHRDNGATFTRAAAYHQRYKLQLWSDFTFYENQGLAPNPALPSDQFSQAETRHITGGSLAQGWRHGIYGLASTTEIGAGVRHDAIDVALLHTQSRITFATISDDHISETELGTYIKNTTSWTPWLRSVLGLRLDAVWMDRQAHVLPINSGHASANLLSPKGSIIIGPFAKTEVFISAGRGFHSNDARGVVGTVNPSTGDPANPAPALVKAFGKEIGLRTQIVPGLQSSLAVWGLNSDSELVYSADAGDTEPNGASRRWGVEWNNHYVAGRWLLLDADLAWTHARYADANANGATGNLIPNAISRVARLGATVHNRDRWSLTAEGRYFSAYPLTQDGSLSAPSAFVVNLQGKVQPWTRVGIAIELLNLFNRRYYDIAYGQDYQVSPTAAANPNGVTVHPGEPREVRVSLQGRF